MPFKVNALVLATVRPLRSSNAPSATETVEADAPSAAAFPNLRVPAPMVVVPVKVFAADSHQVPRPDLVTLVAPVLFARIAVNLLSPVLLPVNVNKRAFVPL